MYSELSIVLSQLNRADKKIRAADLPGELPQAPDRTRISSTVTNAL